MEPSTHPAAQTGEDDANPPTPAVTTAAEERHASWLELFFDLVVVTAVAQISHRLNDSESIADVAITAALFYAVWNLWMSFTLYANVTGQRTRTRPMLLGMFGIAVMAAAIPEATGDHGTVFIVAYLITRAIAAGAFRRSQSLVTSWALAQESFGTIPWFASIWAHGELRYWLWGLAIVLDLVGAILIHFRPQRFVAERVGQAERHHVEVQVVGVEAIHLQERLGLFVVIVLGEAVAQLVSAAADVDWDRRLAVSSVLAFWLLVCLWRLTVGTGTAAIPNPFGRQPPPALLLPCHLVTTAGITAIASGIGAIAEHSNGHLSTTTLWLTCGGASAWFMARLALGIYQSASATWIYGWAVPAAVVPIVVALIGEAWFGSVILVVLIALAGWQLIYIRATEALTSRLDRMKTSPA